MINCDYCGGPATWTVLRDIVHYFCSKRCDGFMQMELFEPAGVPLVHEEDDLSSFREELTEQNAKGQCPDPKLPF